MIVRLKDGSTEMINNRNDLRNIIEPDVYEVMNEIIDTEIDEFIDDENNIDIEEAKRINTIDNKLREDIKELTKQRNELYEKSINGNDIIWKLERSTEDYKKSKSKRVDKEKLLDMLTELTKNLKGCV